MSFLLDGVQYARLKRSSNVANDREFCEKFTTGDCG